MEALDAPWHIGAVTLRVFDLAGMTAFYRDAIGLSLIDRGETSAVLGVGSTVLVRLVQGARQPSSPAGLFHLAILLPSRRDLADWLAHAVASGVPLEGASDHLVSEAIYLSDPEGNGIEIYRDRPRSAWPRRDGALLMATDRLDLNTLLAEAGQRAYAGVPSETRMGHVHLRVGDTTAAEAFYSDVLGLDVMVRYPGASFLASGGYHHHVAVNVWNSRGAKPREAGDAGLESFELMAQDATAYNAMHARFLSAGGSNSAEGPVIADPWGNRIMLTVAAARLKPLQG
ncbi:VOC family protein [Bosea sp. AAP35]|uniref:VOC family protein n=1 Tax=Bosea sp. AAP35 TaxID=1523417 RepID=UPI0006B99B33|nr:VOC family protein [Bosea sp. AAP35]